jgi:hypothetical protein
LNGDWITLKTENGDLTVRSDQVAFLTSERSQVLVQGILYYLKDDDG